ncbi:hypothetical protein QL285_090208 [Trifolium repens]|nr:hypothetical protein QL285_090208 [Trifolium repens]
MSFIIGFPDNTVKMFVKGSDTSMCLAFWQMTMKATLALRIQLTNLKLLGEPGFEVYLEGVPEDIESILQAGITVWVLTGDKNLLADAREKFGVRSSSGEHQKLTHKTNATW